MTDTYPYNLTKMVGMDEDFVPDEVPADRSAFDEWAEGIDWDNSDYDLLGDVIRVRP